MSAATGRHRVLAALLVGVTLHAGGAGAATGQPAHDAALLARGRYLVRIADCGGCHTAPGGAPFAGGRALQTPFGTLYAPNITPDRRTGIGRWTAADFARALHEGIARGGRYLYPAFPFPSYTRMTHEDVAAIWAWLRRLRPVRHASHANTLRWPYDQREVMALWRLRYFEPGRPHDARGHSAQWKRGAYLVEAVAHCGACHTPRNGWGARERSHPLAGGNLPVEGWLAPNITPDAEQGIGAWSESGIARYLRTGRGSHGDAMGPMAEVVQDSLQYLKARDARDIAVYLRSVTPAAPAAARATVSYQEYTGQHLYQRNCKSCHGRDGNGKKGVYPSLRDNLTVRARDPTNLLLSILRGGFQPATAGKPYPYSMPPFAATLDDRAVALIASYVRGAWGGGLGAVQPRQVQALR